MFTKIRTAVTLVVVGALAATTAVAVAAETRTPGRNAGDEQLTKAFATTTRSTPWNLVERIPLDFPTYHPQGMSLVGDRIFLSAVEIIEPTVRYPEPMNGLDRSAGRGAGHVLVLERDGTLIKDLTVGEGDIYHPGGIDFDGKNLWVPVAEYRPNSKAIVYTLDPTTLEFTEKFRVADHIGGVVRDPLSNRLHGVSWGSRTEYTWSASGKAMFREPNPDNMLDYQDCEYVGVRKQICSGVTGLPDTDATPYELGGLVLKSLTDGRILHQLPVPKFSAAGHSITRNPVALETSGNTLRMFAAPDDQEEVAGTELLVYETSTGGRNGAAFDVQAHRGGIGLTVENSLASFARAMELGVSTLELDVQITADGKAVVTHDRQVNGAKCADTAPATAGDPEFPYVGKYIVNLTLAQVRTLDCGSRTLPQFPQQTASPGARLPLLSEVFALVRKFKAYDVELNIETKVEAGAPSETAPREQFVQVVAKEVRSAGFLDRVTIQSFDWGSLMLMRQVEPKLPIVALTNGQQFLQAGQPGASPWLGGIDIDDFGGDVVAAVASFGADALSPVHGDPQNGKVSDPDYVPYTTRDLVTRAHAAGIEVIPWTIDDTATMNKLINDGVDGIITDYPDRRRAILAARGLELPRAYARPKGLVTG